PDLIVGWQLCGYARRSVIGRSRQAERRQEAWRCAIACRKRIREAECLTDGLDDGGMVERRAGGVRIGRWPDAASRRYVGRYDDGRHAHAIRIEREAIRVGHEIIGWNSLGRRYVVVAAAMLVIGDDQERIVPAR